MPVDEVMRWTDGACVAIALPTADNLTVDDYDCCAGGLSTPDLRKEIGYFFLSFLFLCYVFLGVVLASVGRAWLDAAALEGARRVALGLAVVAVVLVALPLLGVRWPRLTPRRAPSGGGPADAARGRVDFPPERRSPWRHVTRALRGGFDAARRTGGARGALLLGFVYALLFALVALIGLVLAVDFCLSGKLRMVVILEQ